MATVLRELQALFMLVIIAGKEPAKMRGAVAALQAAGFETQPTFSEAEALAATERAASVFAIVAGGAIDDAGYQRLALAGAARGALLLRTAIGEEDPREHFERDVVPRLSAAHAARSGDAKPARVAVIVGSVRERRFADVPARWLMTLLAERADVQPTLLDLRDFPMPFFDQAQAPAGKRAPYPDAHVESWTREIAAADAFVMISPEYNHGYTAVLKNAIDWVFREWNHKPLAFVAYGSVGGARSVEQLRGVAIELQMVPTRRAIHLPIEWLVAHARGESLTSKLATLKDSAEHMVDELLEWQGHKRRRVTALQVNGSL